MLRRFAIFLTAFTLSSPVLGQSDADILSSVRTFADATSGQAAGGDKVLTFAREGDQLVVNGMAVSARDAWAPPPEGAYAVMRTVGSAPQRNSVPPEAAFSFVSRHRVRLFIVGEWATPPVVWEIAIQQGGVQFRAIDAESQAGAWMMPANQPAGAAH